MSSNVYTSDVTVDSADKAQLVESIRLREQRLAANVDELMGRVHPSALANRAAESAKSVLVADDGSVKSDRAALIGGVILSVAALVTFLAIRKSRA
ncbi:MULTISPECIES: DUF3618 domain-containing protein [Brevibacterium]|uniref:DUF3618 domain-containing protein n=1 Tax=Brevibacterium pityocampae TaxID=506594 RepID=A0ABP8J4X7_9MICO|nr:MULTISPECIES: DUF3618 domain-containing protein [unclassified Brevibacterium]MCK1803225.1 DUF3618 domain-containing protein [Brevibacterium sp. R8603A2]QCP03910.1 DUF3618 domain-containing protein [Brevibacterium sp. CS2]